MINKNVSSDIVLSGVVGVGVWTVFYLINNSTDPQSYNDYWNIGYPIILGSAFTVAIIKDTNPVLYGLVVIGIQVAMGILFLGGDLTQLPLGLALHFGLLSRICG